MLRILIAEDNAVNRKVLVRLLTGMGCSVDAVENGLEALDAVREQRYDVVLMDVRMPEMDGITATRRLRETVLPAECPPVYAITAGVSESERRECLAAGMVGFVAKPVQVGELRALLGTFNKSSA